MRGNLKILAMMSAVWIGVMGVCRDDARAAAQCCASTTSRSCRATRRTAAQRSTRWQPTWPAGLNEGVKDVVSEAAAYVYAKFFFYPSAP